MTITSKDLADLLQATLILANGFRPSAKARLTWWTTFARISALADDQLPKGGQP